MFVEIKLSVDVTLQNNYSMNITCDSISRVERDERIYLSFNSKPPAGNKSGGKKHEIEMSDIKKLVVTPLTINYKSI